MIGRRLLAAAMLVSMAAGCLSHREYRRMYSLDGPDDTAGQSEEAMPATAAGERPVLQIERVLIPDFLDTTDILLRVDAHEVHASAAGRFAERLSLGVTHALRSDLARELPRYSIVLDQGGGSSRRILVTVNSFDVWRSGRCVLTAQWSILDSNRKTVLSVDHGTFAVPAASGRPTDAAIVAAMADAVRQLSLRIASNAQGFAR